MCPVMDVMEFSKGVGDTHLHAIFRSLQSPYIMCQEVHYATMI